MASLVFAKIGIFMLASAVWCFAQHGGHGGGGGRPGGPPAGSGVGPGNTGRESSSERNTQGSTELSQKRTPDQLLNQNTKLSSNLQKLLPAGTTPQQACGGFHNLGECVSAIHVAHNLGIPFSSLKGKLTGSGSESLGKAIHDLRPTADAKAEKKRAEKQAKDDINDTES